MSNVPTTIVLSMGGQRTPPRKLSFSFAKPTPVTQFPPVLTALGPVYIFLPRPADGALLQWGVAH